MIAGLYEIVKNSYTGSQCLSHYPLAYGGALWMEQKMWWVFTPYSFPVSVWLHLRENTWSWKHYLMVIAFNKHFIFPPLNCLITFWTNLHFVAPNSQWQQIAYLNHIWHLYVKEGGGVLWFIDPQPGDLICHSFILVW